MTDLDKLHHTASAIINAEKPGENTSQRVGRLFDDIISAIGELSGRKSAPLDAAAQVPEWHMPPGVFDLVGFHGFVEPGEVSIVASEAAQTMGSVVCCGGRFVFMPSAIKPSLGQPEAYTSWRRVYSESHGAAVELHDVVVSDRYGTPGTLGVTPVQGKLYVDIAAATLYLYDGSGLVAMPTAPGVAEAISAAVARGEAGGSAPLDADAQIPEWALPPRAFQVLPFGGFIESGDYELTLQPDDGLYQSVMFYQGHFVATPGRNYTEAGKLYTHWTVGYKETVPGSGAVRRRTVDATLRYGVPTAAGVVPSSSKIYIDTSTHAAYVYDGAGALVPLGAGGDHAAVQRVRQELAELRARFELLLSADDSGGIDSFGELLPFLSGVKDTDTLTGLIEQARAEGGAPPAASPDDIDNVINTIFS